MWLRGEFRAGVVEGGKVVAFVPSDENGKQRTGKIVRIHSDEDARLAAGWASTDRIFFFHDLETDRIDSGFINDRTKERILL